MSAAFFTAAIAIFTAIFAYWKERQRAREDAHRERKIQAYSEFADLIFEMISLVKDTNAHKKKNFDAQLESRMMNISKNIIFYGSPELICVFGDWRKASNSPKAQLNAMGKIILEMRNDVGLSNFGLDTQKIHQVYISDDIEMIEGSK